MELGDHRLAWAHDQALQLIADGASTRTALDLAWALAFHGAAQPARGTRWQRHIAAQPPGPLRFGRPDR